MPSSKPWVRLNDIAENIKRVRRYVGDMSLDQFVADEKSADATERCMLRISEAAMKLGSFAENLLPGMTGVRSEESATFFATTMIGLAFP